MHQKFTTAIAIVLLVTDQGEISGRFTKQSAEDLALILRSGALPAPVKIIETGDNK